MKKYFLIIFICIVSFMIHTNKVNAAGGYLQQINTPNPPTLKAYNGGALKCSTNSGYLLGANNWVFEHCNADSQIDTFLIQKGGINQTGYSYVSFNLLLNGVYILDNGNAPMPSITFNKTPCQITAFTSNTATPNTNDGYMSVSAVCPIYANVFDAEISISSIYKYIVNNNYKYAVSNFMFYTDITDFANNLNTIVSQLQQLHTDNSNINDTIIIKTNEIIAWLSSLHTDNSNINQTIIDKINELKAQNNNIKTSIDSVNQSVQDTNDTLKNDSIDTNSANSSASTWNSKNANNGVITQLLTLPITLLNAIVSGIQTSCTSFNLGNLFGTDIILPCINLSSLIGSALFTTIDLLISGFMIYNISKKLIKIFNDFTNLKSNQIDEIYGGGDN